MRFEGKDTIRASRSEVWDSNRCRVGFEVYPGLESMEF
jgi:hypothetical protein